MSWLSDGTGESKPVTLLVAALGGAMMSVPTVVWALSACDWKVVSFVGGIVLVLGACIASEVGSAPASKHRDPYEGEAVSIANDYPENIEAGRP